MKPADTVLSAKICRLGLACAKTNTPMRMAKKTVRTSPVAASSCDISQPPNLRGGGDRKRSSFEYHYVYIQGITFSWKYVRWYILYKARIQLYPIHSGIATATYTTIKYYGGYTYSLRKLLVRVQQSHIMVAILTRMPQRRRSRERSRAWIHCLPP